MQATQDDDRRTMQTEGGLQGQVNGRYLSLGKGEGRWQKAE